MCVGKYVGTVGVGVGLTHSSTHSCTMSWLQTYSPGGTMSWLRTYSPGGII